MTGADRDRLASLLLDLIGRIRPPLAEADPADWLQLDLLAMQQRLQPLLHHRHRDSSSIPPEIRAGWAAAYRASAMQALAQGQDLRLTAALLRHAGFSPIALKGAWLAHHAYPHAALRPLRDIDLLLDPQTVIPAFALLEHNGYRRHESDQAADLGQFLTTDKHLPPLIAPRGTPIELHHRLWAANGLLDHASPRAAEDLVRNRAVGDGSGLLYPCSEDMIAHLVVHAVYGHRLDCGPLVLSDLDYQLRRSALDWSAFWARAVDEGWRPGARLLFELLQRHYATPVDFSSDPGSPIPPDVLAAAPRMLVQDPASRASTYTLARMVRKGVSTLVRRVAAGRAETKATDANAVGQRAKAVLADALKKEVRRATSDMTRLSAWLDSAG